MALQINTQLTTKSGFNVPAGSYIWLQSEYGHELKYKIQVRLIHFKDKASFDQKKDRIEVTEIPVSIIEKEFTPAQIGNISYLDIHNEVKTRLEEILGVNTVQIVQ